MSQIKNKDQILIMRKGGKILAEALEYMQSITKVGISTLEIDTKVQEFFAQKKVKPAFLGYYGFTGAVCISINEEIIHGVPKKDKFVEDGDIVSLDCGLILEDLYLDAARSFGVGEISEEANLLIERTKKSFYKGLSVIKDGATVGDYGYAVENYLSQFNYGIIRDYAGHGIGSSLHENPNIPNYGNKGEGVVLREGMTIALEPMVTLGSEDVYVDTDDEWTVISDDHSLSAHHENTILVTKNGVEILTII